MNIVIEESKKVRENLEQAILRNKLIPKQLLVNARTASSLLDCHEFTPKPMSIKDWSANTSVIETYEAGSWNYNGQMITIVVDPNLPWEDESVKIMH